MKIYFVTCIGYTADNLDKIDLSIGKLTNRCWGWYSNLKLAKQHIKDNITDIAEDGSFNYAVIEEVPMGILPLETKEIQWYKYNIKNNKYQECEKPKWSNTTINWAIG
jgi:hypothetical protein